MSNTNLQRWLVKAQAVNPTYRFRIDQDMKFIANSGSGDVFQLFSSTGNVITSGTINSGAITSTWLGKIEATQLDLVGAGCLYLPMVQQVQHLAMGLPLRN